jgi:hypothetical protein
MDRRMKMQQYNYDKPNSPRPASKTSLGEKHSNFL